MPEKFTVVIQHTIDVIAEDKTHAQSFVKGNIPDIEDIAFLGEPYALSVRGNAKIVSCERKVSKRKATPARP